MRHDPRLQKLATELRNNSTDAEQLLWRHLRTGQIEGIRFRRQYVIEAYIVDFIALAPKVVIEVDGGQHADNAEYDRHRDHCLRLNGYTVLRFWNNDVMNNIQGVLEVIRQTCLGSASPSP